MGLKKFLNNLRYLARYDLKGIWRRLNELQVLSKSLDYELLIETILYEVPNSSIRRPKVLSVEETIDELFKGKNIVRFGDGEIQIIDGNDILFQRCEPLLQQRLREILTQPREDLLVAINAWFYEPSIARIKHRGLKDFAIKSAPKLRRQCEAFIDYERVYANANISLFDDLLEYNEQIYEERFAKFRALFKGKKLVLTLCKEAFDNLKFNIFDNAATLKYEFVPNKNAFDKYDEILTRLKAYDKDFVQILMAGPTAKLLCADLVDEGFWTLDLGHLAKSYDWFKRGIVRLGSDEDFYDFARVDERES